MTIITSKKVSFEDTSVAFSAKSNKNLKNTYWLFAMMNRAWLVSLGTKLLQWAFRWRVPLVKSIVKNTVFQQFCGGESITDSHKTIDLLHEYRIGTILDYSVEGEQNIESFENTTLEIIKTIKEAKLYKDKIPFSVFKVTGIIPTKLLLKKQNKETLSTKEEENWRAAVKRVENICKAAYENQVRLFIDAEESWIQKPIDEICYAMMEKFNKEKTIIFNTYQLYLKASLQNLKNAHQTAQEKDYFLGAKLVRGAYMEKERERAVEMNYPDPVQPDKAASDKDFDLSLEFCIKNIDSIDFCAGTHNEESSYFLTELMEKYQILPDDSRIFFAQLYGMSDHISYNLANAGYNVAKYVPYGPVAYVMPYLFRRAEENTSVAGQSSREFNLVKKEIKRRRQQAKT